MKISTSYPPIYEDVKKAFELVGNEVFTFGDTLYNPSNAIIPDHLLIHEEVHAKQQEHNDVVAKLWWQRYIADSKYRIDQEVEAYSTQYKFICEKVKDKNARYRNLNALAEQLSGKMYGNSISYTDAIRKIRDK